MPIVRVNMFGGRSIEQKRELVQGITAVVSKVCGVDQDGVHVLIEEIPRENWGRGGILGSDRLLARAAAGNMAGGYVGISDVRTVPGGIDVYLAYRRDHINPTMGKMPGFRASTLVRDLNDPDHFLLFTRWDSAEDSRAYTRTAEHDALRAVVRGKLTTTMELLDRCELVDVPNDGGLEQDPRRALHMTTSIHAVRPENVDRYLDLRRTAVNPGMAALDGFCSSTVLRRLDAPNEFRIINQWISREAAEAYHHSSLHDAFRTEVRSLLAKHTVTGEYETVVL